MGRTFIEPSQKIRSLGVKLKLNANQTTIKDKKIILIDDSLVRGTTSHKIVKMLYDAGAKEVHVKIACPEIRHPDFYGVDTPTKKELLAANKSGRTTLYIDQLALFPVPSSFLRTFWIAEIWRKFRPKFRRRFIGICLSFWRGRAKNWKKCQVLRPSQPPVLPNFPRKTKI